MIDVGGATPGQMALEMSESRLSKLWKVAFLLVPSFDFCLQFPALTPPSDGVGPGVINPLLP